MAPERYQDLKRILQAALDLGPAERGAFLEKACEGDPELRQEAESLLAHDAQATGFLEMPAYLGEMLGPYRILREIDHGGMGVVYLAQDSRLGRNVALKLLPPDFAADPNRVRRFEQEVRALSALNHPNIVTILEVGQTGDLRYLVTELVEGETLRRRLERGRMEMSEALDVATQAAQAIAAAHAAGIIHRDLKPENIMLRPDQYVKVLDFGIAKLMPAPSAEPETMTSTGVITGTIRYMSPEQARGRPVDARSDVFSLGVVLYEMLAGRAPFVAPSLAEVFAALLERPPEPLAREVLAKAPELDGILGKALAKRPEDRYQTMAEMAADLESVRTDLRIRKARWRAARRWNPRAARWTAGVACALALAGVAVWHMLVRFRGGAEQAFRISLEVHLTDRGTAREAAISPDGKYAAFVEEEAHGERLRVLALADYSEVLALRPNRVPYRGLVFSPDSRRLCFRSGAESGALYAVSPVSGGALQQITWSSSAVTFAPDGKRIAFARSNSPKAGQCALWIANADGSGERALAVAEYDACFAGEGPLWSPDGDWLASPVRCPGGVRLEAIRVKDGARIPIGRQRWTRIGGLSWMPDGRSLTMAANDSFGWPSPLWRVSVADGATRRLTEGLESYDSLSVAAGGRLLVALRSTVQQSLWLAPRAEAKRARQVVFGGGVYLDPSWTASGGILFSAHGSEGEDIFVADTAAEDRSRLTGNAGANGFAVTCGNGSYVVFTSTRTAVPRVWRMNMDGSRPTLLSGNIAAMKADCPPNGDWIVFESDPPGSLWKAPLLGGTPAPLLDKICRRPVVSPDGKWIACSYSENPGTPERIALVPSEGGQPRQFIDLPIDARTYPRWEPDGRALSYVETVGGVSNIWRQPLGGGPATQLTSFQNGRITDFAWSRDGTRLVFARGQEISDAVLMVTGK